MGQLARRRKRYTYKDYLKWPKDESWEIIDGIAYNMTPAPKVKHQNIAANFYIKIKSHPNNTCYTKKGALVPKRLLEQVSKSPSENAYGKDFTICQLRVQPY